MVGISTIQDSSVVSFFSRQTIKYGDYFNRAKTHFTRELDAGKDEVEICPTPGCCYVFAPCGEIEIGKHIVGTALSFMMGGLFHLIGGTVYSSLNQQDTLSMDGFFALSASCFVPGLIAFSATEILYYAGPIAFTEGARYLAKKYHPADRSDEENCRRRDNDPHFTL